MTDIAKFMIFSNVLNSPFSVLNNFRNFHKVFSNALLCLEMDRLNIKIMVKERSVNFQKMGAHAY